jgi:lysophospholipase L1-like esterase
MIRKLIFSAMLIMTSISANAQNDWGNYGRYEKDNIAVKAAPQNERKAVFMGNSITDNWASRRPDFFKSNGYVGRGIGGQTSYQMLLRFREDVINLHPEVVVINAGTNDIALNNHPYVEDRTFGNIVSMCELAKANKIKVVLTTITPCERYVWRPEITDATAKIQHINARLREYAKKNKLAFVDYFSAMANEKGAMKPGLSDDGCHPTADGYAIMEPMVKEAIQKYVK